MALSFTKMGEPGTPQNLMIEWFILILPPKKDHSGGIYLDHTAFSVTAKWIGSTSFFADVFWACLVCLFVTYRKRNRQCSFSCRNMSIYPELHDLPL